MALDPDSLQEYATQMQNGWRNQQWHYKVRINVLGEQLHYYRLRIQPYNEEVVAAQFSALASHTNITNIRPFVIFGPYDMLLKVWLHPSVEGEFLEELRRVLPSIQQIDSFRVDFIHRKDYRHLHAGASLEVPARLTEQSLYNLQEGSDAPLAAELEALGLLLPVRLHEQKSVLFFTTLNIKTPGPLQLGDCVRRIDSRLALATNLVRQVAIYRGIGFCSILIKGEVLGEHFADVGVFTDWLRKELSVHEASTETYIVSRNRPLIQRDERISISTLIAREGRDARVERIIPEVYRHYNSISQAIKIAIRDHADLSSADQQTINFLHDYFTGVLEQNSRKIRQSVAVFFGDYEETLRRNWAPFVQGLGIKEDDIYADLKLEPKKMLALGDRVNMYLYAVKKAGLKTPKEPVKGWSALAGVRNRCVHNSMEFRQWEDDIRIILSGLQGLRELELVSGRFSRTGDAS